jgi:TetR/AcrR family transcriptional regulator
VSKATLLQAAGMAFAERGYAGASMADIASRAGIQKASLFHHFPTKDLLYMEVLSESLSRFASLVDDARLSSADPFLERLDRLADATSRYLGGHPQTGRLVLREFIDRGPFAEGPGREAVNAILQTAVAFIQSGVDAGDLPPQDARDTVMSICGVHFVYFAAVDVSETLLSRDLFEPSSVDERTAAVLRHIRGVCGAPIVDA